MDVVEGERGRGVGIMISRPSIRNIHGIKILDSFHQTRGDIKHKGRIDSRRTIIYFITT